MMKASHMAPPAMILLAACAPRTGEGPEAAAPKPQPRILVSESPAGHIRVSGPAVNDDSLEELHCIAAKEAIRKGAPALEWLGGVARKYDDRESVDADLVYQTAATATHEPTGEAPLQGGAAPVDDWLIYCDEAGILREGEV